MRAVPWIIRWNINKKVTWFVSPLTSWIGDTSPDSSLLEGKHRVQWCYFSFTLMKVKKNWLYFERWYWGSCWRIMKLLGWLFKVSSYNLVYVSTELTLPLYDKLVFILQEIYILWYQCVLWVRWEAGPWQKGNHKGIKPFGMVKEATLWGITDFSIRNSSAAWRLQ